MDVPVGCLILEYAYAARKLGCAEHNDIPDAMNEVTWGRPRPVVPDNLY